MKKKLANILSEIDLEIDEIDLYGYDIIPVSLAMVHRLHGILSDLRNDLQTYIFPSKEEEIYFFKNQKPELLGRLLYFHKIYRVEVQCPTGSNDVIRLYLNKELDSLTYFFNRNLDFYQYYRSHSTVHDELYFLRGKVDFRLCIDSAQFDKDPNFSTGYDYKVAKILANEMLRIYLNKKLQKLACTFHIPDFKLLMIVDYACFPPAACWQMSSDRCGLTRLVRDTPFPHTQTSTCMPRKD